MVACTNGKIFKARMCLEYGDFGINELIWVSLLRRKNATLSISCGCRGNDELVSYLLTKYSDTIDVEIGDVSPLASAVSCNRQKCMKLLIQHGADVNATCQYGYGDPLLMIAIDHHHVKAAEILVENGADMNVINRQGRTPLMSLMKRTMTSLMNLHKLQQKCSSFYWIKELILV